MIVLIWLHFCHDRFLLFILKGRGFYQLMRRNGCFIDGKLNRLGWQGLPHALLHWNRICSNQWHLGQLAFLSNVPDIQIFYQCLEAS